MTLCRNDTNRLDNISHCPAYLSFGNLCFGLLPITNIATYLNLYLVWVGVNGEF